MTEAQAADLLASLDVIQEGLIIVIMIGGLNAGLKMWEVIRYALNCKRLL